jgi:TP901 family phage tail tape measure protein
VADRTVSVRLQAQISDYMAKMGAAGKATTDLANKVSVAQGRSREGFNQLGRAALIGGGAVVAGYGLAIKTMMDFDAQMALVGTLSHATAGDLKKLRDAAMSVGQGIGYSATQTAEAEAELVKAGISVSDILGGALHGALTLAAAGQTDVASATETAAVAMTQFKLSGKDVPHIADLLAAGADKALGSVGDLSYALASGGLVASQFGLTIDDTIGTLSAFAQAGLIGERGGTTLRQMLLKLSAPGKQASETMKALGITLYDSSGQFVGITDLAGQLHDKLGGLTPAVRNNALAVLFGSRAIQGANVLYQDGAKGIQGWINKVNAAGFAQQQASGKLDNLRGDLTKLKAAFDNDLINSGSSANGVLRDLAKGTTGLLRGFNDLPGPLQATATGFVAVGGAITFVGGASLLMIPKIQAGRAALAEMGAAGARANVALGLLGRAGAVGAVLFGIAEGISAIDRALHPGPNVDKLTNSLVTLAQTGSVLGELDKTFGKGLHNLGSDIRRITDPSTYNRATDVAGTIVHIGGLLGSAHQDLDAAHKDLDALDQSLASLVQGGHADVAKVVLGNLTAAAIAQGVSVKDLNSLLPKYKLSLADVATAAKLAGGQVAVVGTAASKSALQTAAATKKIAAAITAAKKAVSSAFAGDTDVITLFDPKATGKAVKDATTSLHKAERSLSELRARQSGKQTVSETQALAHARQAVADATTNLNKAQATATHSTLAGTYDREISAARSFLGNIHTVMQRGLDPREVQKLLEAGPTAAAPVLRQLVADNSGRLIKMSNDAEATLRHVNAKVLELTYLNQRALRHGNDSLLGELPKAMRLVTSLQNLPAPATGEWLAKHLHMTPAEVRKLATEFGITLSGFIQRTLDDHPLHVTVTAGVHGKHHVGGFAAGGYITGPGSGTSDSMTARVSNGEFISTATATRAHRAELEAWNRGMTPAYRPAPSGGRQVQTSGNRVTNVRQVFHIAKVDEAPNSRVVVRHIADKSRLAALGAGGG